MNETISASVHPDYPWCYRSVQDVSRTFALTVDLLDEPMAKQICLGYLLCRIADTIEDASEIPPETQTELLTSFSNALDPHTDGTLEEFETAVNPWIPRETEQDADWTVVANARIVVATFEDLPPDVRGAIRPPVLEMMRGMAGFVQQYAEEGGLRIKNRHELERYCYYVAGTVGILVTNLLSRAEISTETEATMRSTAEQFGLLLQLTNVSKDVYDDFVEENNIYLPASWLAAEGVEQGELLAPEHRERSARVVERTTAFARSCLDDAQEYLTVMPTRQGNTLAAWLVPYLLSVGTLRELEERPADALAEQPVKVSREEVFAVIAAAKSASQDCIGPLRERVERRTLSQLENSV